MIPTYSDLDLIVQLFTPQSWKNVFDPHRYSGIQKHSLHFLMDEWNQFLKKIYNTYMYRHVWFAQQEQVDQRSTFCHWLLNADVLVRMVNPWLAKADQKLPDLSLSCWVRMVSDELEQIDTPPSSVSPRSGRHLFKSCLLDLSRPTCKRAKA